LAQAQAGDGTVHHSVLKREAAQRNAVQLRRTHRSGMHSDRFQISKSPRSCGRAAASTATAGWAALVLRLIRYKLPLIRLMVHKSR